MCHIHAKMQFYIKKSDILFSVSWRIPDLCVLGWTAKNMVHAWRHNCVEVGVCSNQDVVEVNDLNEPQIIYKAKEKK